MVLANAGYLKATWLSQFSPPMTATGAFTTAASTSMQVPMMRQPYDQAR